jgi:hypothetical protein
MIVYCDASATVYGGYVVHSYDWSRHEVTKSLTLRVGMSIQGIKFRKRMFEIL